jgi:hypothetical protein
MVVLDQYQDGRFRMSPGLHGTFSRDVAGTTVRPPMGSGLGGTGQPVWTFFVEAGVSRYLPVLGRFSTLRFRDAQHYTYSWNLGVLALRDDPPSMTAYRVEDMAPDAPALRDSLIISKSRGGKRLAGLPPEIELSLNAQDVATLKRLDAAFGGGPGTPTREFAERAKAWLRRAHPYSLSPTIPAGAGDPLVRWVASAQGGHCELFAGSLVVLARAAGIPARVVTGFKGGTWNAYSNNYTVRNSDAHAWAELWDPGSFSWLREDPLEASAVSRAGETVGTAALAGILDRSWSARFASLRVFWYRRIVNFDQQTQVDTARAVKAATASSSQWLRTAVAGAVQWLRAWLTARWDFRRVLLAAALVSGGGCVAWTAVHFGGRLRRRRGLQIDPVRREAGRWLRRVDGPAELVAELQRLRYGAPGTWPRPGEVFRRARLSSRPRRRAASRSTS